jgi:hypothetical protein
MKTVLGECRSQQVAHEAGSRGLPIGPFYTMLEIAEVNFDHQYPPLATFWVTHKQEGDILPEDAFLSLIGLAGPWGSIIGLIIGLVIGVIIGLIVAEYDILVRVDQRAFGRRLVVGSDLFPAYYASWPTRRKCGPEHEQVLLHTIEFKTERLRLVDPEVLQADRQRVDV